MDIPECFRPRVHVRPERIGSVPASYCILCFFQGCRWFVWFRRAPARRSNHRYEDKLSARWSDVYDREYFLDRNFKFVFCRQIELSEIILSDKSISHIFYMCRIGPSSEAGVVSKVHRRWWRSINWKSASWAG